MAIVDMQKLSICANKKHRKQILETLQSMGIMEMSWSDIDEDKELQKMDTQTARTKYEKRAESFERALKLLSQYAPSDGDKVGLFFEKRQVPRSELEEAVKNRHHFNVEVADILSAEKSIGECQGIIQKDENAKISLQPWMDLDIPMNYTGTKETVCLLGSIPGQITKADLYAAAAKDMPEPAAVTADVVSSVNETTQVVVFCMKKDAEKVEDNLRAAGFARPSMPVIGIPKDVAAEYDREIAEQQKTIEEKKKVIAGYGGERKNFRLMSDYYRSRADKYRLLGTIPQSKNVFFLEGWVPAEKVDDITRLMTEKFGAAVDKEDNGDPAQEPVMLRNNKFAQNAESILESYGLPQHGRVDPTAIMSVFYVIFFGMMLSDAGYGIVMALACLIIVMKKKNMEEGTKRFLKLFFWCGISTTFWGFMYGSFFGDAIDVIAHTWFGVPSDQDVLKPLWFEPLNDPMRLLMWCMLFGLIHLFTGLGIKGYEMLKAHDVVGFISDIVAWYMFLMGLILMLLPSSLFESISGTTFTFPAWMHSFSRILAIVGAVIILVMSGRGRKNWAIRIALGAYDLYGVTSWLSDVLSYSRLLALGLATGVIASVINMMGSMFGSGVVKVIIFIVVFLLGHTLNIAINALGAYVHTNRLQYVEFFGKFYDAGGRKFNPFRHKNKYIQVKEGN
jgi:V/A-type H+-transporting ATPase subunit I